MEDSSYEISHNHERKQTEDGVNIHTVRSNQDKSEIIEETGIYIFIMF